MNREMIKQLSNILNDVLIEIKKYPVNLPDRKLLIQEKPIIVIYTDMLVRFTSHFHLLHLVFQNITEENELELLEHSIGIVMRSCLQDRIMMNEIWSDLDSDDGWNNIEQQRRTYIKYNSGQLNRIMEIMDSLKKSDADWYKLIDTGAAKKNLLNQYPDFFTNSESYKLIYPHKQNILHSTFISGKSSRVEEDAYDIFESWEFYSKYEHYGPISSVLLNKTPKEKWNRLIRSIAHSLNGLTYLFGSITTKEKPTEMILDKIDELFKLKIN
jgi:hypothetical protein